MRNPSRLKNNSAPYN